jgi:hypothetical protein
MLSLPAETSASAALRSVRQEGVQSVAVGLPGAMLGLITTDTLARETQGEARQIGEVIDSAHTVIWPHAVSLVNSAFLREAGVIRISTSDPFPAYSCPISNQVCTCSGGDCKYL